MQELETGHGGRLQRWVEVFAMTDEALTGQYMWNLTKRRVSQVPVRRLGDTRGQGLLSLFTHRHISSC